MDIGKPIKDSEIQGMKVGFVFYECQMGFNIEAEVTVPPIEVEGFDNRKAWEWKAKNTQSGEIIDYRLTEGMSHYGPRLYTKPQYVHMKDGEFLFELVGAE